MHSWQPIGNGQFKCKNCPALKQEKYMSGITERIYYLGNTVYPTAPPCRSKNNSVNLLADISEAHKEIQAKLDL